MRAGSVAVLRPETSLDGRNGVIVAEPVERVVAMAQRR
jgi:hypothetical protein